jgi:hypothetical protein
MFPSQSLHHLDGLLDGLFDNLSFICSHARRIWYYRRAPLILTLFCGFFCGGLLSEIVQGWLPVSPFLAFNKGISVKNLLYQWKTFDWNDVLVSDKASINGARLIN